MLSSRHPNNLCRTVEIVERVLADHSRLCELFACYQSTQEVVRLRGSNTTKRIANVESSVVVPFIDRLTKEMSELEQVFAQWTLGALFRQLQNDMSAAQRSAAEIVMWRNPALHRDWIFLNETKQTLGQWANKSPELAIWMTPHLERLSGDNRKSVAGKAKRWREQLG